MLNKTNTIHYFISLFKIIFIFTLVLFLPQFFIRYTSDIHTKKIDQKNEHYNFFELLKDIDPFDVITSNNKGTYEYILLPDSLKISKQKWIELSMKLQKHHIVTTFYRYFNLKKKQYYGGLKLKLADSGEHSSYNILLMILQFFKQKNLPMKLSDRFNTLAYASNIKHIFQDQL